MAFWISFLLYKVYMVLKLTNSDKAKKIAISATIRYVL